MSYAYANTTAGEAAQIDLRSDTVTRPTAAMRAAMAAAPVGDDVYGDDPTVNALQQYAATALQKEAALFLPSGTQSNLCAMLAHCARGEEIITGEEYHVFQHEAGGASVLGGLMFAPLTVQADGSISAAAIANAIKPDDSHHPISRLLVLENTVSGQVQPLAHLHTCAAVARQHGLAVHLDGARLFNAAVALAVPVAECAAIADSVSLCLSKGLGAPAGTILAGESAFIRRAHRWRKMLGGGLRQSGILAAAGLYALQHHVERLAEDHSNAALLAGQLADISAINVLPAQTNMVFIDLPTAQDSTVADKLRAYMAAQGILLGGGAQRLRLVIHLDITSDDITAVAAAMRAFFA